MILYPCYSFKRLVARLGYTLFSLFLLKNICLKQAYEKNILFYQKIFIFFGDKIFIIFK